MECHNVARSMIFGLILFFNVGNYWKQCLIWRLLLDDMPVFFPNYSCWAIVFMISWFLVHLFALVMIFVLCVRKCVLLWL